MTSWIACLTVGVLIADRLELSHRVNGPPTRGFLLVDLGASLLVFVFTLLALRG